MDGHKAMILKYSVTDHTADFGIQAFGKTLEQVFENAAYAVTDLITDPGRLQSDHIKQLVVTGADRNDLMMNWLREILYLWHGMEILVKRALVRQITEVRLTADLEYDFYAQGKYEIKNEVKAVTYHQLDVSQNADGWVAAFIVDV